MQLSKPVITKLFIILLCIVGYFLIAFSVEGGKISNLEESLFNSINTLPNFLYPIMQVFQYTGLLFVPVIFAVIFFAKKKYLASLLFLLIIPAKLVIEKLSKASFHRERPKVYMHEAILRGDVQASGLSFFSGHALIVSAIVTVLTPYLNWPFRILAWAIVLGCLFARIYLGAHLPLDVVGGALLGVALGCALLLIKAFANHVYAKNL